MTSTVGPGGPPTPLPLLVAFPEPTEQRRWTVLIRLILAIPLAIVVWAISVAVYVVVIIGWFGALFTGRTPTFVRQLVTIWLRLAVRLGVYFFLLSDVFPQFEFEASPLDVIQLAVPEATRMNRAAVFFRFILALPVLVVVSLVATGCEIIVFFMWFVVLITGKLPESVHRAFSAFLRYQARVSAYFLLLVPTYPLGLFGDPEPSAFADASAPPAGSPWSMVLPQPSKVILVVALVLGVFGQVGSDIYRNHHTTTIYVNPQNIKHVGPEPGRYLGTVHPRGAPSPPLRPTMPRGGRGAARRSKSGCRTISVP